MAEYQIGSSLAFQSKSVRHYFHAHILQRIQLAWHKEQATRVILQEVLDFLIHIKGVVCTQKNNYS